MPEDDIITRGDLHTHCEQLHEPITYWLRTWEKRWYAILIGMIGGILMLGLNLLATIGTRYLQQAPVQNVSGNSAYVDRSNEARNHEEGGRTWQR